MMATATAGSFWENEGHKAHAHINDGLLLLLLSRFSFEFTKRRRRNGEMRKMEAEPARQPVVKRIDSGEEKQKRRGRKSREENDSVTSPLMYPLAQTGNNQDHQAKSSRSRRCCGGGRRRNRCGRRTTISLILLLFFRHTHTHKKKHAPMFSSVPFTSTPVKLEKRT